MRRVVDWQNPGDTVPVDGGAMVLWAPVLRWHCRGTALGVRVLAAEPIPLPDEEPSEEPASAIARLLAATRSTGAQLILLAPTAAFSVARISMVEGVRLFAVTTESDVACWDAALALGQPVYGLRGRVVADVLNDHPASVLSSLAYGQFVCEDGLTVSSLREDRSGAELTVERDAELCAVLAGGFETGQVRGRTLAWRDQGHERVVRLVARDGTATAFTQPRFIAPLRTHA
jgi:hypothetical protein